MCVGVGDRGKVGVSAHLLRLLSPSLTHVVRMCSVGTRRDAACDRAWPDGSPHDKLESLAKLMEGKISLVRPIRMKDPRNRGHKRAGGATESHRHVKPPGHHLHRRPHRAKDAEPTRGGLGEATEAPSIRPVEGSHSGVERSREE